MKQRPLYRCNCYGLFYCDKGGDAKSSMFCEWQRTGNSLEWNSRCEMIMWNEVVEK